MAIRADVLNPCPKCGDDTAGVINSRQSLRGPYRVRRKRCCACGHRWSTAEVPLELVQSFLNMREAISRAAKSTHVASATMDAVLAEIPTIGGNI